MSPTPTLSIAVLTLNEAHQLADCLQSAQFADQLLVIDSGSTDGTPDLAARLGARVHAYPDWQGFAEQRNRALSHCHSDWVLFLDADEVIPPQLALEIQAVVAHNRPGVYSLAWTQVAYGRTLTHMRAGKGQPRLFPRQQILHFKGVVHEGAVMNNPALPRTTLQHRLLHHSRRTIHQSLLKMAQYAQLGAMKRAQAGKRGGLIRGTASGLAAFVRTYIVQRGFTGGREGFLYCLTVALESFFRYVALAVDRDQLTTPAAR